MPPDAPARRMVELHGVYEDGELRLPERLDLVDLKDARLKVMARARALIFGPARKREWL